ACVMRPVSGSVPVIREKPSMWSKDRFSSIRTKTCSMPEVAVVTAIFVFLRVFQHMLAGMKLAFAAPSVCLVLLSVQVSVHAADPDKPMFWSAAQNKDFDKKATAKLNDERHLGTERLMDSAFVAFRNGSGEAELHVKQADLLLIRSGSGTV